MRFDNLDTCIDAVLSAVGSHVVLGIPLGIGKPNRFVNALYRRACDDPQLQLSIFTALTPQVPTGRSLLEHRFLESFTDRQYREFVELDYAAAVRADSLPPNIEVVEFYFAPGSWLNAAYAQRKHVSANYSHAANALRDRGVNVVAQSVARRQISGESRYSLGSNPDLTLDLARDPDSGHRPFFVGVVTDAMPFMPHDAEIGAGFFDAIVEGPDADSGALFSVPQRPVGLVDYAIATHVTSLIEDGGTLQIGIGSLGDAIAHLIRLRHVRNGDYRALCGQLIGAPEQSLRERLPPRFDPFETGLYGASEMLVEGFLDLIDAGVLKRRVASIADPQATVVLHAAFFIGSAGFYRRLHALSDDQRADIEMTGVRFVNTLADDFAGKCAQRQHARCVNSAMLVTLDGAAISDGLADKRVVSGVGGQHDFVSMAQRLPGARSIICVPSTRIAGGKASSNIVFSYEHVTVPRHLRDVVVTEYGAAELRGASDRDVMVRLLGITDARFQERLLAAAKAAGKIEADYRLPDACRRNTPDQLAERFSTGCGAELPHFPLGSDFDATEARLAVALSYLKTQAGSRRALVRLLMTAPKAAARHEAALERMRLLRPVNLAERVHRRLLLAALAESDDARPL